ncbi:C2 domain-containing protein [Favolaschia claudopus]|uniref:C2 domain-containing protein n=1 Tax=Favolaschia claudopus TaxID=2862362 RepID=A0AAW0EIG8_9AGAR
MATADPQQEVDALMQSNGRVAVHSFDPEAKPSEKGAAAGKARDQLKSVKADSGPAARELTFETGKSNVVPTITVDDIDAAKLDEVQEEHDTPQPPGAIETAAGAIPDWYKVGWRQAAGIDDAPLAEGDAQDKGVLDMFLSEQLYGAWYHNAALIVVAVFATHFLTRFHFGWGWLFIVLAFCNTYYSTSMERVRRRARDDIQRELVKSRLLSEHESADWINNFLDRFWLIYEPVLSATIISSVDQILSTNTPAFLDSLRLSQFTLGTKAPRIDKVRTFPKTPDDVVMMDWGISFTPNDVSDLTPRQAANKVNPKIVLSVRLGKGLATATMPILVEDITFSGLMRIRMKLMSNFPHVQVVDITFLEKPVIDYVLKPVGGETFGFDIANIPGLSSFIREMTHATLAPVMYDPNVFTLNLEQLLSGAPLDTAIGVLQVTINSARGIRGTKIGGGTPDPYISLSLNNREELAKTKYKSNTYNPSWMETKFLLVNSLNESLILNLLDYNDHRKDFLMGSTSFELAQLQEDATHEGVESPLLKDGKEKGVLRYDVSYFPVIKAEEGQEVVETNVGIVRLMVHQAKELDQSKSISGDLNPLARVYLADPKDAVFSTPRFKHTNAPVWEQPYEFLCADKASSVITVKVIDDRDFLKDPVVGYMSIKLVDLLESKNEAGRDWFPLSNCKSGKIRISADWKPLDMAGSLHGADQYSPPIGVVRLHLDKATDVKNVEAALGGKSDPYVRVQVGDVTKGRTEVVNNNLNPVWDQIIYIPVHNLKETLLLECMDYQHLTKDRSLGTVELRVSELARAGSDRMYPFESTGKKTVADPIRLGKANTYKGQLHYTAEFVPTLALEGVKFDSEGNELQRAAQAEDLDGKEVGSSSSSSSSSLAEPIVPTIVEPQHSAKTEPNGIENGVAEDKPEEPVGGVKLSEDELLTHQSGVIVFNVVSGKLAKKGRLEILLDDGYWPCFTTLKARSNNAQWETVGEGFIKELDFGRVWLRLNEAEDGEKDDIIAEWKGDSKAFLKSTLNGPHEFTLQDGERPSSTVMIEARYVPAPVQLEARESVNNQGILRVDLLDATGLRAVDRGGKSDPFGSFSLNGQKVFKSQTKKKTLTPVWNENFTVQVPSRVAADFFVEIYDWDRVGTADSLGTAQIDLADLEPFEATERTLELQSSKGPSGSVRVRLMFLPEIIAKSRKNTSTFSGAGRAMTQIGGMPIHAGKGVIHGVTGVFKKGHKDDESHLMPAVDVPAGQASHPIGQPDALHADGSSLHETVASSSEPGTLRVTVLDAKDLSSGDSKPYATIRVGDKEYKTKPTHKTATPEWNETFNFAASEFTPKLYVWIHDHKTLGKDKLLGEGEIDIWRHIKPEGVSGAEVSAELQGGGLFRVRLEFDANVSPVNGHGGSTPKAEAGRSLSISSPSRFSLRGRRPGTTESDE